MAKASEQRWAKGEPCGLVDGVPISIKDLVLTKGWSTLRGSKAEDRVKGLRIAFSQNLGQPCPVDPEVGKLVTRAAATFAELGADVETVDLPWSCDLKEVFLPIWNANYANFLRLYTPEQLQLMDSGLVAIANQGNRLSLLDYMDAMNRRNIICAEVQALFNQYDLLLTPTMPIVAFEAGRLRPEGFEDDWDWVPYTYLFNLTEQPAASVPCGFTQAGLPVGLQIAGSLYSDALILQAARYFEKTYPCYQHHPVL